jgi:predicted RNase H-like HicB family nuclease
MVQRYFALLEKEPDSLWGVYFPDLPGCVAAAASAETAVANAGAALRDVAADLQAEGEALPRARNIEELNADSEVRAALAAGAALIAIPLLASERDAVGTAAE